MYCFEIQLLNIGSPATKLLEKKILHKLEKTTCAPIPQVHCKVGVHFKVKSTCGQNSSAKRRALIRSFG